VRSKPLIRVWPANLNWPPGDVSTGADHVVQSVHVRQARVVVPLVRDRA
jgi:hypothetical protein